MDLRSAWVRDDMNRIDGVVVVYLKAGRRSLTPLIKGTGLTLGGGFRQHGEGVSCFVSSVPVG